MHNTLADKLRGDSARSKAVSTSNFVTNTSATSLGDARTHVADRTVKRLSETGIAPEVLACSAVLGVGEVALPMTAGKDESVCAGVR